MNIGIIDADLIGAPSHRFPNLVSMKLAGFHTNNADNVELLLNYNNVDDFDRVYISKVFTQTPLPFWISERIKNNDARIIAGGTGFYFDKAPPSTIKSNIAAHIINYMTRFYILFKIIKRQRR